MCTVTHMHAGGNPDCIACLLEFVTYTPDVLTGALNEFLTGALMRSADGVTLDEKDSEVVKALVGDGAHVHLLHEVRLPRPLTTDLPGRQPVR